MMNGHEMSGFPEQLPHGDFVEIFPEVFYVKGQIKITAGETVILTTRSMTIVRSGTDLTIINSLRLDEGGLAGLDQLGTVQNIVRIGSSHGRDDAFYSDRYDAPVWAPANFTFSRPAKVQKTLQAGTNGPIADASILLFETTKTSEAVICLHRHGGILLTADSFLNMLEPDEFTDEVSAPLLREAGFFRPAAIGPGWRSREEPAQSDYDRLLELSFRHLLPGHGEPILHSAKETLKQAVEEQFSGKAAAIR